jgi:UDP-glucose 4-epimerase
LLIGLFASHRKIVVETKNRRPGDVAVASADITLAGKELDWRPEFNLETMIRDYWRFTVMNPNGYNSNDSIAEVLQRSPA